MSRECVKIICNSIDILISDQYIIKDNDAIRILWFRFIKLFVPKYLKWDLSYRKPYDIKLKNEINKEINEFNDLIKSYNIAFNKGSYKFNDFASKLWNKIIDTNDRYIIKIIEFYEQ